MACSSRWRNSAERNFARHEVSWVPSIGGPSTLGPQCLAGAHSDAAALTPQKLAMKYETSDGSRVPAGRGLSPCAHVGSGCFVVPCTRPITALKCSMDGGLPLALQDMINGFDAHHKAVIHVAHLITPSAEAATRVDALAEQHRLDDLQSGVAPATRLRRSPAAAAPSPAPPPSSTAAAAPD